MRQLAPTIPPRTESAQNDTATGSLASPAVPPALKHDKLSPGRDLTGISRLPDASPPLDHKAQQDSGTPSSQAPAREVQPLAKREAFQDRVEASGKAPDKPWGKDMDKGFAAPLPEQKQKERAAVAAGSISRQGAPAPPSRSLSSEAVAPPALFLTLRVHDPHAAMRTLEAHIGQADGRVILRQSGEGHESLKAEMASQKVASFLKRLETMGPVDLEQPAAVFPEGTVTLSIKIDRFP